MFLHAVGRAACIIRERPSKLLTVLTPTGWRRFSGLMKERRPLPEKTAAHAARMATKRAEFESELWQHEGGLSVRRYDSYDDYVAHQSDKLNQIDNRPYAKPDKIIQMFRRRFELVTEMPQRAHLCSVSVRAVARKSVRSSSLVTLPWG